MLKNTVDYNRLIYCILPSGMLVCARNSLAKLDNYHNIS